MVSIYRNFTDEELESCVDGVTNLDLLRSILKIPGIINEEGYIDPDSFANIFASELELFIPEDHGSEEWAICDGNNWNWGFDIADNLNMITLRNHNEKT